MLDNLTNRCRCVCVVLCVLISSQMHLLTIFKLRLRVGVCIVCKTTAQSEEVMSLWCGHEMQTQLSSSVPHCAQSSRHRGFRRLADLFFALCALLATCGRSANNAMETLQVENLQDPGWQAEARQSKSARVYKLHSRLEHKRREQAVSQRTTRGAKKTCQQI